MRLGWAPPGSAMKLRDKLTPYRHITHIPALQSGPQRWLANGVPWGRPLRSWQSGSQLPNCGCSKPPDGGVDLDAGSNGSTPRVLRRSRAGNRDRRTALEKFGAPVYVRHEIVHNRHVVEKLERKGAAFVEEPGRNSRRRR